MRTTIALFLLGALLLVQCKQIPTPQQKSKDNNTQQNDIASTIIHNQNSFYYIDFKNYPQQDNKLPIGVFDSGTGGLTVLKAIVNYDENNNINGLSGSDGAVDFKKETFIYLGDQANMPYGNYSKENKEDLLNEHILKDVQFLMGNNYYSNANDKIVHTNKQAVKAIVIACNTATAYGKEKIEAFLKQAKSDIKVIGVIDAGVRGALDKIKKEEDAIIGVLATAGTVASKGYRNTILEMKESQNYTGTIQVFSQGGVGIAEAVDEDPDYFDKNLKKPRDGYKGPSLDGEIIVDKELMDLYNFDFSDNKILCDTNNTDTCNNLQINDAENYVRYHLVTLLEKIRQSETKNKLKLLILGCTHYPYMTKEIKTVLKELYNFKKSDGTYVYRNFMAEQIQLVDPAVDTAKELYAHLKESKLFNPDGDIQNSEFYISVANRDNPNNQLDTANRFTYAYKYGRSSGEIQEYVKVVPFSKKNISTETLQRFEEQIPNVYNLMRNFNETNTKTKHLLPTEKIGAK